MRKFNYKRLIVMLVVVLAITCLMATTAFAAGTGDVAGAVESTWSTASTQIKSVVDNVVFPAIDLILAVFFFAKLGTAYFEYRKSGQFEWAAPAILFAGLVAAVVNIGRPPSAAFCICAHCKSGDSG